MRAVRPYTTRGAALVGASVIAVVPLAPPPAPGALTNDQVRQVSLAAESSLLYIAPNVVNALLSMPAWEVQAMDRFADAMLATGSWQVWSPTNVFGFDEQDPPKLQAFVDALIPFQPFSSALGEDLSWWARANLPMSAGCAALPGACPDLGELVAGMFQVPMSQLYSGYTFPAVTNPFTGEETSWSGQYVQLEPWRPFTSTWEWLVAPPQQAEAVSPGDAFETTQKLVTSVFASYYPFVQNSEWYNDDQTDLAPFFRSLAPILCSSCDPADPYDNPWLYDNYPPDFTDQDAAPDMSATPGDISSDQAAENDAVSTAIVAVDEDADGNLGTPRTPTPPADDAVTIGTETHPLDTEDDAPLAAAELEADDVSGSGPNRSPADATSTTARSINDEAESEANGIGDNQGDDRGDGASDSNANAHNDNSGGDDGAGNDNRSSSGDGK